MKVCKFGGTSLSTREQFDKAIELIMSDDSRRYAVVSAPGRTANSRKMTDLLIDAARGDSGAARLIKQRIEEIVPDIPELAEHLGISLDCRLRAVNGGEEMVKALGEYFSAKMMVEIMKKKGISAEFACPKDIGFYLTFKGNDAFPDESCYAGIGKNLNERRGIIIIPGFYSYTLDGRLRTLPRGGSDTSGAVIARAVKADLYENWTDEDGLRRADPKIVKNPQQIPEITYREARELAYMGFKLQADALIPLIGMNIPVRVLNTNNPKNSGTLVVENRIIASDETISGVASERGYTSVNLFKMMMDKEIGFGRKVFSVLENMEIPYEHTPTGIDTMSIVLERKYLNGAGVYNNLVRRLNEECGPLEVSLGNNLAMVVVAGEGIRNDPTGVYHRTIGALRKEKIQVHTSNKGGSDTSCIVGVDENRADDSVRAIYREFFE